MLTLRKFNFTPTFIGNQIRNEDMKSTISFKGSDSQWDQSVNVTANIPPSWTRHKICKRYVEKLAGI